MTSRLPPNRAIGRIGLGALSSTAMKKKTALYSISTSRFFQAKLKASSELLQLSNFSSKQSSRDCSKDYEMKISIKSNHGNQTKVIAGEIDVLDNNQSTVRNVTATVYREQNNEHENEKLVNQQMIKKNEGEAWTHLWPPEDDRYPLEIIFRFLSVEKPTFIRFWPAMYDTDANIKDVTIHLNGIVQYIGELNKEFCTTVIIDSKKKNDEEIQEIIENESNYNMIERFSVKDDFGHLPLMSTQTVSIHIVESYSGTESFGLRKILFFDVNGKLINSSEINVQFDNIKCYSAVQTLFGDTSIESYWRGAFLENNELIFTFKKPKKLVAIVLSSEFLSTDMGIKKMSIKINDMLFWVGKLACKKQTPNLNVSPNNEYLFFLTNHRETRKNILKYFFHE